MFKMTNDNWPYRKKIELVIFNTNLTPKETTALPYPRCLGAIKVFRNPTFRFWRNHNDNRRKRISVLVLFEKKKDKNP